MEAVLGWAEPTVHDELLDVTRFIREVLKGTRCDAPAAIVRVDCGQAGFKPEWSIHFQPSGGCGCPACYYFGTRRPSSRQ